MEKQGYRETLAFLEERYPGRLTLTVKETADALGANIGTVYDAVKRKRNPLPSQRLAGKIVIPIPKLASWLC